MSTSVRVLCIGDVVGRPGRAALSSRLAAIVRQHRIDCVIANVENVANGSGITPPLYEKLKRAGVNLMSMGDHAYRRKESLPIYQTKPDIVRPANQGVGAIGRELAIFTLPGGAQIALFTLLGRQYMKPCDCFLRRADKMLAESIPAACKLVFVDMHAEATSEKIAMGWHLDGRVTCVFGTHTHVQTADERLLPSGTAYITDLGMTGPHCGVLGRRADRVLHHLLTNMPTQFDVAEADTRICGVIVQADATTGKALSIERVNIAVPDTSDNSDRDDPVDDGGDAS